MRPLCVPAGDLRMDVLHNRRHDLLGVRVDSLARTRLHQRSGSEVSARYGDTIGISLAHGDRSVRILDSGESAGDRIVARDGGLVAACLYSLPRALHDGTRIGTVAEFDAYSDWRRAIPPDANVLVAPVRNSAAFAWFTLQRPSYLTVDQSSGVVFSRATALEVRRRSQVLLPLMDPDWRLLSNMTQAHSGGGKSSPRFAP